MHRFSYISFEEFTGSHSAIHLSSLVFRPPPPFIWHYAMQSQSGVTVVISNGILRPIGNQVGESIQQLYFGCTAAIAL